MNPNNILKGEAVKRFGSCVRAAKALNFSGSKFSRIVQGHIKPSDEELLSLQRVFGSEVVETLAREGEG